MFSCTLTDRRPFINNPSSRLPNLSETGIYEAHTKPSRPSRTQCGTWITSIRPLYVCVCGFHANAASRSEVYYTMPSESISNICASTNYIPCENTHTGHAISEKLKPNCTRKSSGSGRGVVGDGGGWLGSVATRVLLSTRF